MKNFFFFLSLFFATCLFFACNKESSVKSNIEGTWGLTHYEYFQKIDGVIYDQEKDDCNPYAPTSSYDGKLAIINTNDNHYLLTFYSWDTKKNIWVAEEKMAVIIEGNKMFVDGGTRFFSIQLTSDILTLEANAEEEEDGSLFGKEGSVWISIYSKYVFRKMSDLGE